MFYRLTEGVKSSSESQAVSLISAFMLMYDVSLMLLDCIEFIYQIDRDNWCIFISGCGIEHVEVSGRR